MSKRPKRPHEIRGDQEAREQERDTTPDKERDDAERVRPRTRKERLEDEAEESHKGDAARVRPTLRGTGISEKEAMAPARLSNIRVREAIVRIQREMDEEPTEPPDKPGPPPEVRIDWVRSRDRTQKIERVGANGFRITGIAEGGARVALGVDGLIFAVEVDRGDSPGRTIDRLQARLEGQLVLDRVDPSTAILRRATEEAGRA